MHSYNTKAFLLGSSEILAIIYKKNIKKILALIVLTLRADIPIDFIEKATAVDQEYCLRPIRKLESFLHPRVDSMPTIFTGKTANFNPATTTDDFYKVIPRMN